MRFAGALGTRTYVCTHLLIQTYTHKHAQHGGVLEDVMVSADHADGGHLRIQTYAHKHAQHGGVHGGYYMGLADLPDKREWISHYTYMHMHDP